MAKRLKPGSLESYPYEGVRSEVASQQTFNLHNGGSTPSGPTKMSIMPPQPAEFVEIDIDAEMEKMYAAMRVPREYMRG